jgi:hypothetical protein
MTNLVDRPAITLDNIHLSELIRPSHEPTSVEASDRRLPFNCTDPKILEFLVAATAPNTLRAYEGDVRHFLAWGGRVRATSEQGKEGSSRVRAAERRSWPPDGNSVARQCAQERHFTICV